MALREGPEHLNQTEDAVRAAVLNLTVTRHARKGQRHPARTPWDDGTGTARAGIPPIDSVANAPHIVPRGPNHIWLVEVQVV
jgi:hypothetical protein